MDYEYKILQNSSMHNRCCGGRAWCVQVKIDSFSLLSLCTEIDIIDDIDDEFIQNDTFTEKIVILNFACRTFAASSVQY